MENNIKNEHSSCALIRECILEITYQNTSHNSYSSLALYYQYVFWLLAIEFKKIFIFVKTYEKRKYFWRYSPAFMLSLFTLIFVFYNCILKPFITFRIGNSDLTRSRCLGLQNDKNLFTLLLFFIIFEKSVVLKT